MIIEYNRRIEETKKENETIKTGNYSLFWELIRQAQKMNKDFSICIIDKLSKKLINAMYYFMAQGIEFTWTCNEIIYENENALSHALHLNTERAIAFQLFEERKEVAQIIHDYNISINELNNIDLLCDIARQQYHIETEASLILIEKKSVFTPNALQAKQLGLQANISYVNSGKCKYIYQSTLKDKLITLIEMKYLNSNSIDIDKDCDYTTLTELTQKYLYDVIQANGRDYTIPLSACEPPDNYDGVKYERACY